MAKSSLRFVHRQPNTIVCACWSPDGRSIATGDGDRAIQIWDAQTGRCVMSCSPLKGNISSIAWSPDGSRIVSGDMEGHVAVWETTTGKNVFQTPTTRITSEEGDHSAHVAWSPDGRLIASSGYQRNGKMMILLWNATYGESLMKWSCAKYIAELQWSPNGAYLAAGDSAGKVHLWTPSFEVAEQEREVATYDRSEVSDPGYVTSIVWSDDSNRLAFGDTLGIVQVWDVTENQILSIYTQEVNSIEEIIWWNPKPINGLAWMPSGTYLASAHRSVQIREATTGHRVATYPDPFEEDANYIILQVDWSPDRRHVVSVGDWHSKDRQTSEGCMYVWEVGRE